MPKTKRHPLTETKKVKFNTERTDPSSSSSDSSNGFPHVEQCDSKYKPEYNPNKNNISRHKSMPQLNPFGIKTDANSKQVLETTPKHSSASADYNNGLASSYTSTSSFSAEEAEMPQNGYASSSSNESNTLASPCASTSSSSTIASNITPQPAIEQNSASVQVPKSKPLHQHVRTNNPSHYFNFPGKEDVVVETLKNGSASSSSNESNAPAAPCTSTSSSSTIASNITPQPAIEQNSASVQALKSKPLHQHVRTNEPINYVTFFSNQRSGSTVRGTDHFINTFESHNKSSCSANSPASSPSNGNR